MAKDGAFKKTHPNHKDLLLFNFDVLFSFLLLPCFNYFYSPSLNFLNLSSSLSFSFFLSLSGLNKN